MTDMDQALGIPIRELDRRQHDGIDVRLLWNSRSDAIFVVVDDERAGDSFELAVDAADALDAFRHPYAYAGQRIRAASSDPATC